MSKIWIATCMDYYKGKPCKFSEDRLFSWNGKCCYGEGGQYCSAVNNFKPVDDKKDAE